jgi:hypothetical protein
MTRWMLQPVRRCANGELPMRRRNLPETRHCMSGELWAETMPAG